MDLVRERKGLYGYYSKLALQRQKVGKPQRYITETGVLASVCAVGTSDNPFKGGFTWKDAYCVGRLVAALGLEELIFTIYEGQEGVYKARPDQLESIGLSWNGTIWLIGNDY